MTTEDFLIQNGCYWQTVEAISESFPQPNVVSSFTYKNIKPMHHIDDSIVILFIELNKKPNMTQDISKLICLYYICVSRYQLNLVTK